jgi:hypothetical protein
LLQDEAEVAMTIKMIPVLLMKFIVSRFLEIRLEKQSVLV